VKTLKILAIRERIPPGFPCIIIARVIIAVQRTLLYNIWTTNVGQLDYTSRARARHAAGFDVVLRHDGKCQ
jgi:hypothetical protein